MPQLSLKPTQKPVRNYYAALQKYGQLGFDNEGNIRNAFEDLLRKCAGQFHWTLVPEYQMTGKDNRRISIDAALIDEFHLPRGYWEAKDSKDDLDLELRRSSKPATPAPISSSSCPPAPSSSRTASSPTRARKIRTSPSRKFSSACSSASMTGRSQRLRVGIAQ